jgi:hypothetical protein
VSEPTVGLIYGKIAAIMAEVEPIAKGQYNEAQKYNFRGVTDVYNAVQPILAKHRVFSSPEILDHKHTVTLVESKGYTKEVVRSVIKCRVRFYAEDGSSVFADVIGEGADHGGDKASAKATSQAHKYAVLQILMIPTERTIDSEADENIGRGPADEEDVRETAVSMLKRKFMLCGAVTNEQKEAVIQYVTAGKMNLNGAKTTEGMQELLRWMSREKDLTTLLDRATGVERTN